MKKGCFLKFIIIFTIVLAAVLYLIQNKYNELFLSPGKKLALSVIEKSWQKDLSYIKDSTEKDSLKSLLKYYISNSRSTEQLTNKQAEDIINYVKLTFKDSTITKEELNYLNKLIKNALKNEE